MVGITPNLTSSSIQVHLSGFGKGLSSTVEQLSSGIRLNRSSDDPVGMSISKFLTLQIDGLRQARANAQNGMSMLQTAEGSIGAISDLLLNMRELAVAASNGTYTADDRDYMNQEFNQLRNEIDRIASTTKFNRQTLFDGSSTALYNTDNSGIDLAITGLPQGGNYKVDLSVEAGTNAVYKSNIMQLTPDAISSRLDYTTNTTNIHDIYAPNNLHADTGNYTVDIGSNHQNTTANITGEYRSSNSSWTIDISGTTQPVSTNSGYVEFEWLSSGNSLGAGLDYRARFVDATTGEQSAWTDGTATATSFTVLAGSSSVSLDLTSLGAIEQGDKVLMSVSAGTGVTTDFAASGGGTIALTSPTGATGAVVTYTGASSLTPQDNFDGIIDTNRVNYFIAELDSSGAISVGSMAIEFAENNNATTGVPQTVTGSSEIIVRGGGTTATRTTTVRDIASLYDANGVAVLDVSPAISFKIGDTLATINIDPGDTMERLNQKFIDAIVNANGGSSSFAVDKNLSKFVSTPTPDGTNTVEGTFILQSALAGFQGEISFLSGEQLVNALGFSVVSEPTEHSYNIKITNNDTKELVLDTVTSSSETHGVDGLGVYLKNGIGVNPLWDSANNRVTHHEDPYSLNREFNYHVDENRTIMQIGISQGDILDVSIPEVTLKSLGLANSDVSTMDHAEKSLLAVDKAMDTTTKVRVDIGIKIQRLQSAETNISSTEVNLDASRANYMDTDIAQATTALTRYQVLQQAAIALLAQSNQNSNKVLTLLQR